jgi:hypothetical protein
MKSDTWPVYSPFAKETFGRGMKEGEKKGKREGRAETHVHDILTVLAARNLGRHRRRRRAHAGSTDRRQLATWVRRAVTVEKTSDLFD